MASYTLQQLQSLAEYASGEVIGPSKRHTPEIVQALLNESLAQYYLRLTDSGHPHATTRATLTTSADTSDLLGWPTNSYVALPTDFLALLAIRIQTGSGSWEPMTPFAETEDAIPEWFATGDATGLPLKFRIGTASDGTDIARLRPYAAATYTIEIVYIPKPEELSETKTAKLIPGTADWVVCDTALKMLENIGMPEANQAQALMSRKNAADKMLVDYASRKNRAGPVAMQDTRSQRRHSLHFR